MPEVSIKIKNLPQIRSAFGMAPSLMKRNLNTAIRKAVFTIGRTSRILTPVDTGRLRASHREQFRDMYGEIGTHTIYDVFVHEGTRYMRPRPYLRTAVTKHDFEIQGFFKGAVQDTLNEIGKRT